MEIKVLQIAALKALVSPSFLLSTKSLSSRESSYYVISKSVVNLGHLCITMNTVLRCRSIFLNMIADSSWRLLHPDAPHKQKGSLQKSVRKWTRFTYFTFRDDDVAWTFSGKHKLSGIWKARRYVPEFLETFWTKQELESLRYPNLGTYFLIWDIILVWNQERQRLQAVKGRRGLWWLN